MYLSNLFKCTIEGDSSWFHLMVGTPNQWLSLKLRVGRPNGAREWYCDGMTGRVRPVYRCAWPLIIVRESYQTTKVELLQEHTRDKVRRRFTLLVTAETWWDDRAGTNVLVVLAAVVVRRPVKSRQR